MNVETQNGTVDAIAARGKDEVLSLPRLPPAVYHDQLSHVSSTMLRTFLRSRRAYFDRYVSPEPAGEEATEAMRVGTAVHAAVLEPAEYNQLVAYEPDWGTGVDDSLLRSLAERAAAGERPEIVRIPPGALTANGHRRGKSWEAFAADLPTGAVAVKADQYERALEAIDFGEASRSRTVLPRRCRETVNWVAETLLERDTPARELIQSAAPEQSVFWSERAGGEVIPCRARIDLLTSYRGRELIADIKTTSDPTPAEFARAVERFGYHVQGAWYRQGELRLSGDARGELPFVIIAVGTAPPYIVQVYELDAEDLLSGWDEAASALEGIAACHRSGDWSEPDERRILTLSRPAWARRNDY